MKNKIILVNLFFIASIVTIYAQQKGDPKETEYYTPVPKVITPGKTFRDPPSDAIILFNGKNMNEWVMVNDLKMECKWTLENNMMKVNKKVGDIQTRRNFTNFQLHIEYQIPTKITGTGQARGNSGIFLASLPLDAGGYELQVLDNYDNTTYVNGQAGSIYKQSPPLVNACLKPGEWQWYDVIWTAPKFNEDGSLKSPALVTAIHNGVLVQNNYVLKGNTPYIGQPSYQKHGPSPIKLQAHGDKSEPISYRNIWVREL